MGEEAQQRGSRCWQRARRWMPRSQQRARLRRGQWHCDLLCTCHGKKKVMFEHLLSMYDQAPFLTPAILPAAAQ